MARYGKDSQRFRLWHNKVQKAVRAGKRSFYDTKVRDLKDSNIQR